MRLRNILQVAILAGFASLINPVFGSTIITFNTSGTTDGPVQGTATFTITATQMTVVLTNTTTSVDRVARVLDGLSFTTVGGSGLTLVSVSAPGFIDCTNKKGCVTDPTFTDQQSNKQVASPFGWGYNSKSGLLAAGNGSYKPAGIVNNSVTPTSGIFTDPHNDYLLGPVTFTFNFTTAPTSISAATFFWGTGPATTTGTCDITTACNNVPRVPEPSSVILLSTGAAGVIFAMRRRRQKGQA